MQVIYRHVCHPLAEDIYCMLQHLQLCIKPQCNTALYKYKCRSNLVSFDNPNPLILAADTSEKCWWGLQKQDGEPMLMVPTWLIKTHTAAPHRKTAAVHVS